MHTIIHVHVAYIREGGWFEAGEVREKDPVPAGEKNVLCLNVAMTDLLTVTLLKDLQQLKHYPLLLHHTQEGACAVWVWFGCDEDKRSDGEEKERSYMYTLERLCSTTCNTTSLSTTLEEA